MAEKEIKRTEGLPEPPPEIVVAPAEKRKIDFKRIFFILLGLALFFGIYYSPPWPDAVDPLGKHFPLPKEGKAAIALFLMAGTWWVFEVIPIGATAISIGLFQALFAIRPAKEAFKDFFDPSVWFIFGSVVIGLAFTKTGLTKRLAVKMLGIVGEKTNMILLGTLIVVVGLTLVMAHTAAAATVFPILLAVNALYGEGEKPTRFGKGLFIGMAYAAGAGSIITYLGAARGPAKEIGPMKGPEKFVIVTVGIVVLLMGLQAFVPALQGIDRAAIMLIGTLVFFFFKILTVKELEDMPWNIILLFGGAMSIGFCLWKSGGAQWLAIEWLVLFKEANWLIFVLSGALCVLLTTNFIMNVAAIALSLPISLVVAKYLGVTPEVIVYASLVTAGMPFVLLIGAAPNAIAYGSEQFSTGEFFKHGIIPSILLMIVLAAAIYFIWPVLGMPVLVK